MVGACMNGTVRNRRGFFVVIAAHGSIGAPFGGRVHVETIEQLPLGRQQGKKGLIGVCIHLQITGWPCSEKGARFDLLDEYT